MEMLTEDSSMAPLLTEYWNLGLSIQDSVNIAVLLSEPTPNLVPIYLQCNRCRECCGSGFDLYYREIFGFIQSTSLFYNIILFYTR